MTTVTIWQKDEMDPCTAVFNKRETAVQFKEKMENLFIAAGKTDYRVTLDSPILNDESYYNDFAKEFGITIPALPELEGKEYTVSYAVEGRFYATVKVPKGTKIPDKNSSEEEWAGFLEYLKGSAIIDYYDADFGQLETVDSSIVNITDSNGNFLWETGTGRCRIGG